MNEDDDNFEILNSWFAVIGMITMFWSPTERFIDQILHMLHNSKTLPNKRNKPTSVGQKIDFISDNMPKVFFCNNDLVGLGARTRAVALIRNIFVHGVIDFYDKDKIVITKVDGKQSSHVVEMFTYDFESLNNAAMNLEIIRKEWSEIALKLSCSK